MPKVTWLGNVDDPNCSNPIDAHVTWGDYTFPLDVAVEVTDPHIIKKARTNRFFRLQEDAPVEAAPIDDVIQAQANHSWPDQRPPDEPATGRVDYNEAAPKRSHKKKVVQP